MKNNHHKDDIFLFNILRESHFLLQVKFLPQLQEPFQFWFRPKPRINKGYYNIALSAEVSSSGSNWNLRNPRILLGEAGEFSLEK